MENLDLQSKELFKTFRFSTGINVFFIDASNKIHTLPGNLCLNELKDMDFDEIFCFINKNTTAAEADKHEFHTYFTANNFIYNILFCDLADKTAGAIIAGPMMVLRPNKKQLYKFNNSDTLTTQISKLPLVSLVRTFYLGILLCQMFNKKISINEFTQKTHGNFSESSNNTSESYIDFNSNHKATINSSDIYNSHMMKMRNLIINGNINGVRQLINNITSNSSYMLLRSDCEYSLKSNFIKICMMCCSIAVKGNAPYYKMMSLSDIFIQRFEQLTNTDEIIELTFRVVESYTRAVSIYSSKLYSKPVKDILHYIQTNYSNKITLNSLSETARLSTFYISRLIKKETGLSLTDNINKIRIEESQFLLQNTDRSVLSISQTVGFKYQNHFADIFKKFTGISPNEFRNNSQKP